MIHSALSAGGAGGTADFAISGLPAGAVVSVADDAAREFQLSAIPGEAVGDWSWVSNRGDGGALNLGLDPTFITTVNPTSFTGITDWQWLSGSLASPDVINLGQTSPIVIANTHTPETQEDVAQIVQASGTVNIDVTGNDSHPDGFDLEVVSATGANNGTVSVNPDGTIDYTPDPGFAGDDVFQYTVSRFLPESCQDIQDFDPSLTDGEYEIYPNGGRFTVYCEGLDGTPAEYLPLVNTGSSFNYGQYTAGGASPGTNVRTNYTKLRLDPATLIVDIGDQLFSSSSGSISHSGGPTVVTSMPLGVAMACRFNNRTAGLANIDLLGTSFFVDDTFTLGGFEPDGVATFSAGDQVVDVTGGGSAARTSPPAEWALPTTNEEDSVSTSAITAELRQAL